MQNEATVEERAELLEQAHDRARAAEVVAEAVPILSRLQARPWLERADALTRATVAN